MPLYEYQCDACGRRFEKIQKFSDQPLERCELCGKGPVHKLLSSPAIQFKGSGWYITDYAKKGSSPDKDSAASPAESAKTDSPGKSGAKSETAAAKTESSAAKTESSPKSSS